MITKTKIKQLEKRCNQIRRSSNQGVLFRHFTHDGKPRDNNGVLLDKKAIALLDKQEAELNKNGEQAIKVMHFYDPKI